MKSEIKQPRHNASVFDAVRLAQLLADRRKQLGLTTRQIAQRANISQPYVVALERPRNGFNTNSAKSPSPTVDMIARLANALQMSANELFSLAIRPAGKHILLFMEDDTMTSLDRARNTAMQSATDKRRRHDDFSRSGTQYCNAERNRQDTTRVVMRGRLCR